MKQRCQKVLCIRFKTVESCRSNLALHRSQAKRLSRSCSRFSEQAWQILAGAKAMAEPRTLPASALAEAIGSKRDPLTLPKDFWPASLHRTGLCTCCLWDVVCLRDDDRIGYKFMKFSSRRPAAQAPHLCRGFVAAGFLLSVRSSEPARMSKEKQALCHLIVGVFLPSTCCRISGGHVSTGTCSLLAFAYVPIPILDGDSVCFCRQCRRWPELSTNRRGASWPIRS